MATRIGRKLRRKARRALGWLFPRPAPRIVMTLLCRNERDIIAEQVAFHLAMGVDFVIAMDNASEDGTPTLLAPFARTGKLKLLHQPDRSYDQGGWVTGMARMAAREHGADWIINSDADEFWWPAGKDLKATFAALDKRVNIVVAERRNFRPPISDQGPFYERMLVRELASEKFRGGALEPKVAHRAYDDVTVKHGNHGVLLGERKLRPAPAGTIEILHFPVRSFAQWSRKISEGAAILQRHPDHPPHVTAGWRHMNEQYLERGRLRKFYDDLAMEPGRVAEAPDRANLLVDTRLRDLLRGVRAGPDQR